MCVPRDTSVYVGLFIVYLESMGNCQNLLKRQTLATCENIIFRPVFFFSFLASDDTRFIPFFYPALSCVHHVFVHCCHFDQ